MNENNNYSSKGKEKVESEDIRAIDNEIEDLEMNKDNHQNKTNTLEKLISTKTKETNNGNYRKLITDENERFKLILEAHNIGHEGYYKHIKDLRKTFIGII